MKEKMRRILAAVLAGCMLAGQCVYAKDGSAQAAPQDVTEVQGEQAVDEAELFYPRDYKRVDDVELTVPRSQETILHASEGQEDYSGDYAELILTLEQKLKDAILSGETKVDIQSMRISKERYPNLSMQWYSPYIVDGIELKRYVTSDHLYYHSFEISNSFSIGETREIFQKIDARIKEIIGLVNDGMSESQKALVVHDYFATQFAYENDGVEPYPDAAYHPGDLFLRETGVCNAYAYGYRYILELLGIKNHVASSDSMNHAWNIVRIEGKYYHVDCTWDDPTPDQFGKVMHKNFLASDDKIRETNHSGWQVENVPEGIPCSSKGYDGAYWREVKSPVVFENGLAFFIKERGLYRRDPAQGERLLMDLGKWYVWQESPRYYTEAYSGLFFFDGKLYYNTSTEIRRISTDGTEDALVYTPGTSNGYVYGIRKHGNKLEYGITQNPQVKRSVFEAPVDLTLRPKQIVMAETALKMEVGGAAQLQYSLVPADASADVTWDSDRPQVAEVSDQGRVTAVSVGNANITVRTDNGLTAVCAVTVAQKISGAEVTLFPESYEYDGQEKRPEVAVQDEGRILEENRDYTVLYENNLNAGTAQVTLTGIGYYTGTKVLHFEIEPKSIRDGHITISADSYVYDGKEKRPEVRVENELGTLEAGKDYTVSYSKNVKVGTAKVTATGIGNYTGTISAEFKITGVDRPELPFTDVKDGDWYCSYVGYVYIRGLMTGLQTDGFGPEVNLSRGQFATILYRMEGEPAVGYTGKFSDVPNDASQFYLDAVMWASSDRVKIITGYTDGAKKGMFGPSDLITREQMAVMMYRYAEYKGYDFGVGTAAARFKDEGSVSPFAAAAMPWTVRHGLITGDQGRLNPQGLTSRAVCATILQRFLEKLEKL